VVKPVNILLGLAILAAVAGGPFYRYLYAYFTAEPKIALVIPANDPARKCP
jgi:hypothetical protein